MKTAQELYAHIYDASSSLSDKAADVTASQEKIDKLIQEVAPRYTIDRISKVDLAILRLAVYELVIEKKVPPKVAINEAVELAKELGSERSPAFVNAVLGKIYDKKDVRET